MSNYGEPWIADKGGVYMREPIGPDGERLIAECVQSYIRPWARCETTAQRIVACVNALADMPNPAAVPKLIEAVGAVLADEDFGLWFETAECPDEELAATDPVYLENCRRTTALAMKLRGALRAAGVVEGKR